MQERSAGQGAEPQRSEVDSGLACLVILLHYFDIATDPQQLSREFRPAPGRFDSLALVRAARGKGLKARVTRAKPERLETLPLPAIALGRDGRFFIIAKVGPDKALVKYESEAIIQANMREICRGRTVLLVAHRLSTVRRADRILVMDKGSVAEDGTHDELMQKGGLYAELVRKAMG